MEQLWVCMVGMSMGKAGKGKGRRVEGGIAGKEGGQTNRLQSSSSIKSPLTQAFHSQDMHYVGHRENGTYRHITITRLYYTISLNDY